MEIQWDVVLPPLTVIGAMLLMWWRLDNKIEDVRSSLDEKIEDVRTSLDEKIEDVRTSLDTKIDGVRTASEDSHKSIRDDLCDLKVTTATISNDIEWIKKELARD